VAQFVELSPQTIDIPYRHVAPLAAPVLLIQDFRILHDLAYLCPRFSFQRGSADLRVAADALATETVAIRPRAAIIAEVSKTVPLPHLTNSLSVERISAQGAACEPLKEVAWPPPA